MEVITNDKLVERRAKIGRYASLAGMLILGLGLAASFNSQYIYYSIVALLVGFIVSQVGTLNMLRWGRKPRADQVLAASLKGIDRKFRLYNYLLPASHVLVGPTGLFVFLTKSQSGGVTCAGRRCSQKLTPGRIFLFMGRESLGNPVAELQLDIRNLKAFIAQRQADLDVSVRGAVVFFDPRVDLTLNEPEVPILQPKGLKNFVRARPGDEGYLGGEERRLLIEMFDQVAAEAQG
jgi:hypothetical protein